MYDWRLLLAYYFGLKFTDNKVVSENLAARPNNIGILSIRRVCKCYYFYTHILTREAFKNIIHGTSMYTV